MSRVYISLPSIVNVEIKEIRPIALFQDNDKNIFFLDDNNKKIKANNNSINFFSVPILTQYKNNEINYKRTANLLKLIKYTNKVLFNSINELLFKKDLVLISLDNGTTLKMKKNDEINNTKKLLSFLDTIKGYKSISDYKYVDLSIPEQIIVKENKKI